MRKVIALALSLAIQAAAATAPLVHAHESDHDGPHHGSRTVHTHWTSHTAHSHDDESHRPGPAVDEDDHDRAIFFGVFVAVPAPALPVAAPPAPVFALPVPAEREAHASVRVAHAHDPPLLSSLPSRAPPACLS